VAKARGVRSKNRILLRCLCVFAPLFLFTPNARPLELSLEENKGESGTVGYVDIDRVFKEYSGTLEARKAFLGEIKKKEGSINERKRVIYALKADIAKLRQERAFALTLPSLLATEERLNSQDAAVRPSTAPAPAAEDADGAAAAAAVEASSGTADVAISVSTAPPVPETVSVSTASEAAEERTAEARPETPPATLPGGVNMPGVKGVPANYFKFSISTSVADIDAAIADKESELQRKEDRLRTYQRQVERELLEYEDHRSEIVLGRIYVALKELAVKTGVSVVVDKRNILFGHSAVDLTGKLLKALEEGQ